MADQIAILNQGEIVQIGSPEELYNRPLNPFLASFLGEMNILYAKVTRVAANQVMLHTEIGSFKCCSERCDIGEPSEIVVGIRPQDLVLNPTPGEENSLRATVIGSTFLGDMRRIKLQINGKAILDYLCDAQFKVELAQKLSIALPAEKLIIMNRS